jgi:D-sedoheptulose 7-phosphate isomerase
LDPIEKYLTEIPDILARVPHGRVRQVLELLQDARGRGSRVFVFGNGGSAATASHFACDLGKGTVMPNLPRFKVIALNDNLPTLTAYANDRGYETVFAEPLINLAEAGDLAIGISGSGNSANVLRAVEVARARGLRTIGLIGFEGGKLKDCVDVPVIVPATNMGQIEDVHLMLTHALCEALKLEHPTH